MTIQRAKRVIVGAALVGAVAVVAGVLVVLTVVVVRAGTGADPSDAFTEAPIVPDDIDALVEWDPDGAGLIRSVEPTTRDLLAATWVRGLAAVDRAATGGEDRPLSTWFSDGALRRQRELVASGHAVVATRWERHRAAVGFYSLDGQVAALRVTSEGTVEVDGRSVLVREDHQVVMVLRDGNWRIERLTRQSVSGPVS